MMDYQYFICGCCANTFSYEDDDNESCLDCGGPMCYTCWDQLGSCCDFGE